MTDKKRIVSEWLLNLKDETDQGLLNRLQQGDSSAFSEIYERYWWSMYVIAYRKTKSKEVSEELVQDLFAGIWKKRTEIRVHTSLSGYLKSSIHHLVINYFQAMLVREKHSRYLQSNTLPDHAETEETLDFWELQRQMEQGVEALPDKSREIFELSRFENHSNRDIARQLDLSEKAVEYHITKALKLLRTYLKDFLLVLCWLLVRGW